MQDEEYGIRKDTNHVIIVLLLVMFSFLILVVNIVFGVDLIIRGAFLVISDFFLFSVSCIGTLIEWMLTNPINAILFLVGVLFLIKIGE